ncbi:hypothetical protein EB796_007199 [Bugula neritina]|uniref:Core Histone H2A/H2B/H3 domain-containing protein n=1 Tax=Bugula neritina TaxID=10212 RepID=A0A7J7KA57_BUGNE|nr:hypothetical protein EB796_007199 [Bugula neritina]
MAPKVISESNKKGRRYRKESYAIYIYKILSQVHPDTGVSSSAMSIMDSFMNDIFTKIAGEASKLSQYSKKPTMTSREVQTAVSKLQCKTKPQRPFSGPLNCTKSCSLSTDKYIE